MSQITDKIKSYKEHVPAIYIDDEIVNKRIKDNTEGMFKCIEQQANNVDEYTKLKTQLALREEKYPDMFERMNNEGGIYAPMPPEIQEEKEYHQFRANMITMDKALEKLEHQDKESIAFIKYYQDVID
jgi:hypothetical protein